MQRTWKNERRQKNETEWSVSVMIWGLLLCLVGAAGIPSLGAQAPASAPVLPAELRQSIEEHVALEFAQEPVGSLSIGVVVGDELVWERSFGFASQERRQLATPATLYRVGSISKQFTALMLLQLVHEGKVHLSDPVTRYLPELQTVLDRPDQVASITLVQLATMTSGLSREPQDLATFLKGPPADWESVMLKALRLTRIEFEPDTHYHYSNIGYAVLGAALARAAEKPFIDYVESRILRPLGMTNSVFAPTSETLKMLATGHRIGEDGTLDTETPLQEHRGRGYKVPNGALYSSVRELARFLSFELGHGPEMVLPASAWLDNLTRLNSASGDLSSGYGIGFQAQRVGNYVFYGHGGSVAGYRASALIEKDSDAGVVVLRDVGGRLNVSRLAQEILTRVADHRLSRR